MDWATVFLSKDVAHALCLIWPVSVNLYCTSWYQPVLSRGLENKSLLVTHSHRGKINYRGWGHIWTKKIYNILDTHTQKVLNLPSRLLLLSLFLLLHIVMIYFLCQQQTRLSLSHSWGRYERMNKHAFWFSLLMQAIWWPSKLSNSEFGNIYRWQTRATTVCWRKHRSPNNQIQKIS